ncbi:MAG: sulfite exporter TauE/SafE family protein [Rhodoplanes sp.]|uniref:sulfite exporter TauE/SafE family protein n=1 Tax=Rhodoplanes sp. TaxID=1968906 RepID=UPI00184D0B01|nr:sulfite exporter TauE/SafE family protein [Rhodoplanes sp.]NVO12702.1 sulfite exporter TauE/SafE family protein [Rhodoplanes sp.]
MDHLGTLAIGAATFLLAGLVKGTIGLGLPTVAMGLLGLAVSPAIAAAVLVVPSFVTNAWQMLSGPALAPLLRRLWPMLLGVVFGTLAGSRLFGLAGPGAAALLGAALAAYGVVGLAKVRLPRPTAARETWLGPLVGVLTGLVTAATGVFVLPAVPYLQALGLDKDDLVQALGLSFTVSTVALGAGLLQAQILDFALAGASLAALLPAAAGMGLGQLLRARVSEATFRTVFFAGLLVLGGYALLRGLA